MSKAYIPQPVYIPHESEGQICNICIELIQFLCEKYGLEKRWNTDLMDMLHDVYDIGIDMGDPHAFKVFIENSDWKDCLHKSEMESLEAIGKLYNGCYGPCEAVENGELAKALISQGKAFEAMLKMAREEMTKESITEKRYDPFLKRFVEGKGCADDNEDHSRLGGGQ